MTSHTADRPAAVPPGGRGVAKATVDAGADGQRLDNWLIRELKGVPKSAVYRILRDLTSWRPSLQPPSLACILG